MMKKSLPFSSAQLATKNDLQKLMTAVEGKFAEVHNALNGYYRIRGLAPSSGPQKATVIEGKAEHMFDEDPETCVKIGFGNETLNYRFWFQFQESYIDSVAVKVKGFSYIFISALSAFEIAIETSDGDKKCGLMDGKQKECQVNKCHAQNSLASKAYFDLQQIKDLHVCSVALFGTAK